MPGCLVPIAPARLTGALSIDASDLHPDGHHPAVLARGRHREQERVVVAHDVGVRAIGRRPVGAPVPAHDVEEEPAVRRQARRRPALDAGPAGGPHPDGDVADAGSVLEAGTPHEVVARRGLRIVELDVPTGARGAADLLRDDPRVEEVAPFGSRLRIAVRAQDPSDVARDVLGPLGVAYEDCGEQRTTVEDAFVALVHEDERAHAASRERAP